jgi:recombination associated protein RdgC
MLFKNAHVYRLSKEFDLDGSALADKIAGRSFAPCTGIRPSSFGWIPPLAAEGPLTHEVAGAILLRARREDKVVPVSAVNDAMAEKIERLEGIEGRKLSSKERQRIKEETSIELIPRALARSKQIMGYIAPRDRLLVIDTSSATEAEMFIDCLRDSLGSFPVTPPRVKVRPTDYFTQWILNRNLPDNIALGEQCDLLDPETGATVTCRRQDLATREIRNHIEAGKTCHRIGLRWHGELSVSVDKELALRQLKMEGSDIQEEDDPVAQLDAALVDMSMTLARFLPELFSALGGEAQDE